MPNIHSLFTGTYLKAADLNGQPRILTMSHVQLEKVGQGQDATEKPILYFQGLDQGLVLNKTNGGLIAGIYGDMTEQWTGQPIEIYPDMVAFQGKQVPALRVRRPQQVPGPWQAPGQQAMPGQPQAPGWGAQPAPGAMQPGMQTPGYLPQPQQAAPYPAQSQAQSQAQPEQAQPAQPSPGVTPVPNPLPWK